MNSLQTPAQRRHRRGSIVAAVGLTLCAVGAWILMLVPGERATHQTTITACLTAAALMAATNLLYTVPTRSTGRPWLQARELDLLDPSSTYVLANYWKGARAIGGALVATPTELRFVPNRVERRFFRAQPFTEQIADCRVVSAEPTVRGLVIALTSGAVLRFTVADVAPIVSAIESSVESC